MRMKTTSKKDTASAVPAEPPIGYNASNGGQTRKHMMPVRRKRRDDWCIPRINEQQLLQEERAQLEHLNEIFRGTTPVGRELYRKILCGIRNRLERPDAGIEEVLTYARSEFGTFPSLEPEFKFLFLMDHGKSSDPGSISLDGIATFLVIVEAARIVVLEGFPKMRWAAEDASRPQRQVGK